jgi:pimeloyl-ACP methyl ester carboxylesterase
MGASAPGEGGPGAPPDPPQGIDEVPLDLPGGTRALLVTPAAEAGPLPGWVVLHGITVPGIDHVSLRRFARALAGTGARVLVPEILPWTRMDFAPAEARRVAAEAVRVLHGREDVAPGGVRLAGFSFGAPQALALAADPEVAPRLARVLSWGGYAELETALRFGFTGEHRSSRGTEFLRPDPYVRWVVGANLLPDAPGYAGSEGVADALRRLAHHSGVEGLDAFDPAMDQAADRIRAELPRGDRALFSAFAPEGGGLPERGRVAGLVDALAEGAREARPLLDPLPGIDRIEVPVHLLHGRQDILIPWSEVERAEALLRPRAAELHRTVTGLFAHSAGGAPGSGGGPVARLTGTVRESWIFLDALARILAR